MIGFLLWLGSRSENAELRKRLEKYEPPAPPPAPRKQVAFAAVVVGVFIALLIAANSGGGVPVPVPGVQAEWTRCKQEHRAVKQAHRCMLAKGYQRSDYKVLVK